MSNRNTVDHLIDIVLEGLDPRKVINKEINEATKVTKGMCNAYAKLAPVLHCPQKGCGVTVPKYRGRYPTHCPDCNAKLVRCSEYVS